MQQPDLVVTDKPSDIEGLRRYIEEKDFVAFDSETTGVTKHDRVIGISLCADASIAYYAILAYWDPTGKRLVEVPGMFDAVKPLILTLKRKKLIMHNGVFDCMMTEAFFKVSLIEYLHTDTMILAHLLNENEPVGLKALGAARYGDDAAEEARLMKESVAANGGSLTKTNYEMYKADCWLMGKYGAKDAWLTYMLFTDLVPELYEQELDKFFYEDESMPLLKGPTYDLNTTGLQIDTKALAQLKKTLEAECLEAKDFILQEIKAHVQTKYPGTTKKNAFNIGASQQLSWLLFGVLGLEFGVLTKAGKEVCKSLGLRTPYTAVAKRDFIYAVQQAKDTLWAPKKKVRDPWAYIACDKKTLVKLAPKYQWITRLLEYQRKTKLLTTYVKGIESRISYGIIQSSFLQHGTTSGRYASRNPNFQNLPRDDKRIKACVVSRPGKVFVGADYSQLEPRVFAYFSNDTRLLAAFRGADDFYSVIGMGVFNKTDCVPRKDGSPDAFGIKYKTLRDLSKVVALASTYGATAHQLAPTTGKSIDETQMVIDDYFEEFPGVAQMMLDSHAMAKRDGFVKNLFGRPRRMPEATRIPKLYGDLPHAELPYDARNLLNLAVNHRIQSTGASIVNRAAIAFHRDAKLAGIDCKLVAQVHDSLIVECNKADADNVLILLQNAMELTTELPGITLEAIPKIGVNFSEV